jgi:Skp family chaperone for outer membrane proteins
MDRLLLALSIARAQVSDLEWLVEQTDNRLRESENLLSQAKAIVESIEASEQELKNLKAKASLLQVDLDRIEEKNKIWAKETIEKLPYKEPLLGGFEYPNWRNSYRRAQEAKELERQLGLANGSDQNPIESDI